MATVSISYSTYDPNDQTNERILGTEHIDNIEEILVPLNDKNTQYLLRKHFQGRFVNVGEFGSFWVLHLIIGEFG
ncbi:hypothetical protein [Serratia sp. 121840015-1]